MLSIQSPTLTLFHMNTCPHCVALMPTWNNVKKTLDMKNIPCVSIEYRQMSQLPPILQNISGFPTIQIIKNNKVIDEYRGDRSHDSIVQFALSHVHTPPVPPTKPKPASHNQNVKLDAKKKGAIAKKNPSKKTI